MDRLNVRDTDSSRIVRCRGIGPHRHRIRARRTEGTDVDPGRELGPASGATGVIRFSGEQELEVYQVMQWWPFFVAFQESGVRGDPPARTWKMKHACRKPIILFTEGGPSLKHKPHLQ